MDGQQTITSIFIKSIGILSVRKVTQKTNLTYFIILVDKPREAQTAHCRLK